MSKPRLGRKDCLYGDDVSHPLKDGVKSSSTPLPVLRYEIVKDPDDPDTGDEEVSIFKIKRTPGTISGEMRRRVIEVGGRNIVVFEIPKRRRY